MPQTKKEKRIISDKRRGEAYDLLKDLAMKCGIMQHERDGGGYDKMVSLILSGELELKLKEGG